MVSEDRTISQMVAKILKDKIINGGLPFGQRLHIRNLAQELGVSSSPVREALNRLTSEGLAELRPHLGTFVINPSEKDIEELFAARLLLELHLAEDVVRNASGKQIGRLRQFALETASRPVAKEGVRELAFHQFFAEISGNRTLARLSQQVNVVLEVLFVSTMKRAGPSIQAQHAQEEEEICQALETRDVATLKEALKRHNLRHRELVLEMLYMTEQAASAGQK